MMDEAAFSDESCKASLFSLHEKAAWNSQNRFGKYRWPLCDRRKKAPSTRAEGREREPPLLIGTTRPITALTNEEINCLLIHVLRTVLNSTQN